MAPAKDANKSRMQMKKLINLRFEASAGCFSLCLVNFVLSKCLFFLTVVFSYQAFANN